MFLEKAKEVVRFAMTGPLLQPKKVPMPDERFGLVTADLDEAFQLYGLPIHEPENARQKGLLYLPDIVAAELGNLTEYGSAHSNYSTVALVMKERIRTA